MGTCKICGRFTVDAKDHAGCVEKRRLELAESDSSNQSETSTDGEIGSELGALLGHIASERSRD